MPAKKAPPLIFAKAAYPWKQGALGGGDPESA